MSDWNDSRLDQLEHRVDDGFKRMDERFAETPTRKEMNQGFRELRKQNGELRQGIERTQAMIVGLNRTLLAGAIVIVAALIGVIGAPLVG